MRLEPIMDLNSLYENHIIKEEMVIGPEIIQDQPLQDILCIPVKEESDIKAQYVKFKLPVPQENTEEKQFLCDICLTCFKFRGNLIRHLKLHSGQKFLCRFCSKKFKSKIYLAAHQKCHLNDKKDKKVTRDDYRCDLCQRKFNDKSNFNRHKKKYCKVLLDQLNKSNCGSSGTANKNYTKNKVVCDICNKQYASKSSLLDHILKHKDVTFRCLKCKKCFSNKRALTRHLHIHNMNGKYECKVCSKKFDRASSLKQHNGSNNKQIVTCKVCNEQFNCKFLLGQHKLEHNSQNGRPYSCKLCKRGFVTKHNLKSHKKSNCCRLSFSCGLCSKKYTQFCSLERHMVIFHNEKTNPDKLV